MIKPVPFAITMAFFILCLKWFPAEAWNPGEPIPTMQIPQQPFSATEQGFDTVIDIDAIIDPADTLPTDRAYLHSELGCTGDMLRIPLGGHLIADCDDPVSFRALAVHGILEVRDKLRFHTLMTYPGSLLLSTPGPSDIAEFACAGLVDTTEDPFQWGLGIIATGGTVHLQGAQVGQTLAVKLVDAQAGSSTLSLASPVAGWAGAQVYLSPTYIPGQSVSVGHWRYQRDLKAVPRLPWEMASVASVDGLTVTLDAPLTYDHTGGYAVHTSRNLHVYTEGAGSHPERLDRCHMAVLGATTAHIVGVEFQEMGRTRSGILNPPRQLASGAFTKALPSYPGNTPGRYAGPHIHHATAHVAEIAWNVVHGDNDVDGLDGPKSGIVVHRTHANVHHNFVYGTTGAGIVCGEAGGEAGRCDDNVVSRHGNNAGGPYSLLPPGKHAFSDTQGIFVVPRLLPVSELHPELTEDDLPASQFTRGECYWAWDHLFTMERNLCTGIGLAGAWRTWAKVTRKPTLLARVDGPEPAIVGDLIAEHGEAGPHHMSHEGWKVFDDNVCDGLHCESHWAYNIGTNDITNHSSTDTDPLGGAPCFRMEHSSHLSIEDSTCAAASAPYAVHINNGNPLIETTNFNWPGYGAETN